MTIKQHSLKQPPCDKTNHKEVRKHSENKNKNTPKLMGDSKSGAKKEIHSCKTSISKKDKSLKSIS